ncbi:MAG: DinB family protein [Nitrososphaerota archaeon]
MPSSSRRNLTTEQVLTLLAATPERLVTLTTGLAPSLLHTAPNQDEWSPADVLAHLRSCADIWGNCIMTILAEDTPTLRAVNPRTWIKQTNYHELEFEPSLRAFVRQRAELLAILEPLPLDGWARAATVTGAGNVLKLTVLSYAQRMALHERPHVKQIERAVRQAAHD